jgi:hypothetical protein
MLSNLLPGIREIRTPLASGYLWLLIFWLWLPSHLTKVAPTSGIPGDITHLAHYGGRAAVGIALSFAAYLIGILSQFLNFPFVRLGTLIAYIPASIKSTGARLSIGIPMLGISFSVDTAGPPMPDFEDEEDYESFKASERERLFALSSGRLGIKGLNSLNSFASEKAETTGHSKSVKYKYRLLAYLLREVPNEGNALVGREPDLYSVYDRLISEYEFRTGVSLPLGVLVSTLAFHWSPWWLFAILPLLVLLATGSQQRIAAGDLLADAVRLKRIEVAPPADLAPEVKI